MRPILLLVLSFLSFVTHAATSLTLAQSLPTSGARAVKAFRIDNRNYLAVAQLSKDIPGSKASMNGGNSEVDILIYQANHGQFKLYQRLPGHGNEDLAFFHIGKIAYLASASIRSGRHAPYNLQSQSFLYRFDGKKFHPIQRFSGYATKGVIAFQIGQRHFLGFANGVVRPKTAAKNDTHSTLYEWDGKQFKIFQRFNTQWAYGFDAFQLAGQYYLALADHKTKSKLYRFDGKSFKLFQTWSQTGGRAFTHFQIGRQFFLAYANLTHDSQIFIWNGHEFSPYQTLAGKAGREFEYFKLNGKHYLFRVNFMTGTQKAPQPVQMSVLYRWENKKFKQVTTVQTTGGVDAAFFELGHAAYLALSNSLSKALRFSNATRIYRVN